MAFVLSCFLQSCFLHLVMMESFETYSSGLHTLHISSTPHLAVLLANGKMYGRCRHLSQTSSSGRP